MDFHVGTLLTRVLTTSDDDDFYTCEHDKYEHSKAKCVTEFTSPTPSPPRPYSIIPSFVAGGLQLADVRCG